MEILEKKSIYSATFLSLLAAFFCLASLPTTARASALAKPANNLGLVGYWSMEDGGGLKATDFSGKGNIGTLTNMDEVTDWVAGKRGRALDFDGVDDYVLTDDNSVFDFGNAFSLSLWAKADSNSGDYGLFTIGTFGSNLTITLEFEASNVLKVRGYNAAAGDYFNANHSSFSFDAGNWHHYVVTYDGSQSTHTDRLKIYVDTISKSFSTVGTIPTVLVNPAVGVAVGRFSGIGRYFDGTIDEVRVYNRALTAGEITSLHTLNGISNFRVKSPASGGLMGYWAFEENTGLSAFDSSGKNLTGTLTNMDAATDWVLGRRGKALDFDGGNDYVELGNVANVNSNSSISISAWIKADSLTSYGLIVGKDTTNRSYSLAVNPGATDRLWVFMEGVSGYQQGGSSIILPRALNTGAWEHIVFTYDQANQRMKAYLNGVLTNNIAASGAMTTTSGSLQIGAGTGGFSYFDGIIDEVRIYDRAISDNEVRILYESTQIATTVNKSHNTVSPANLVAWHTFDGPSLNTTTSTDRSGQGNDGTLTNGPVPRTGKVGQALQFDGGDDSVVTKPNPSGLGYGTGDFSWFAWIFPQRINDSYEMIWAQGTAGIPYFAVRDDTLHFYLSSVYESASGYIAANIWQHVGVVRSAGTVTLYKNGVAHTSTSSQSGSIDAPGYAYISSYGSGGAHSFKGAIDDIRIYNKALTTEEILRLYNSTK